MTPYEINNDENKNTWDGNIICKQIEITIQMALWRNKAVAVILYEPGSTFKLITASAALEEGITTPDKEGEFSCTGGIRNSRSQNKCWRHYRPHGSESLRQALMNSCNPVFIGIRTKIGVPTYYSYLNKFGLLKPTGIDFITEKQIQYFHKRKQEQDQQNFATIAFGKDLKLHQSQLATAVSSIANGGVKITPRVAKKIINSETGEAIEILLFKTGEKVTERMQKSILKYDGSVALEKG